MKQVHKYIGSYNSLKVWQQEFLMLYPKFLYSTVLEFRIQKLESEYVIHSVWTPNQFWDWQKLSFH